MERHRSLMNEAAPGIDTGESANSRFRPKVSDGFYSLLLYGAVASGHFFFLASEGGRLSGRPFRVGGSYPDGSAARLQRG